MNKTNEYLIYLLSCFLNDSVPEGADIDFKSLYNISLEQNVIGIIGSEIQKIIKGPQPDKILKNEFMQQVGLTVIDSENKEKVLNIINDFLNTKGVKHSFVKGSIIKNYYPSCYLRTSGDIDVIVQESEYERTVQLLSSFMKVKKVETTVASFILNDVLIELHRDADVSNDYFKDFFTLCYGINDYEYQLDDYYHLLYLICHLAKHLKYEGAGIRLLMDLDVVIRHIQDFDSLKFFELCKKANVYKCSNMLLSFCKLIFNTPISLDVNYLDEQITNKLYEIFLDGGVFGELSNNLGGYYARKGNGSFIITLLSYIFVSPNYLKTKYNYAYKHSILIPLAFFNRLFDGLFKRRGSTLHTVKQISNNDNNSILLKEVINELDI